MKMNTYGSVYRDGGIGRSRSRFPRLSQLGTALLAAAFVVTAFSGTATAIGPTDPGLVFTFNGILSDDCGSRAAEAVGFADTLGEPVLIKIVDTAGNEITIAPNLQLATYVNPYGEAGVCSPKTGSYPFRLDQDCSFPFPTLDIALDSGAFQGVVVAEFHSQSGACNWVPPLAWGALVDPIGFKVVHPQSVYIHDVFSVSAFAFNNLAIPVVLTVEIVPQNEDICSVVSYGTSSSGTSIRAHEYVLQANGTAGLAGPNGNRIALGDNIALSASVKASAVGNCRFTVLATIKTAAALQPLVLDSQEVDVNVTTPPPYADLGGMTVYGGGCFSGPFIESLPPPPRPPPIEVAAGEVTIDARLYRKEGCHDFNDRAELVIEMLDPSGEWVPVSNGGVVLSESGMETAHGEINLEPGTYYFRKKAHYSEGWFSGKCIKALIFAGGSLTFLGLLIAIGGAIGAFAWAVIMLSLWRQIISISSACRDSFGAQLEEVSPAIEVLARQTSLPDELQRSLQDVADSVGDTIDGLDYDGG